MTIARSAAAGAVVGGGVGYAWARKQGRNGREAATMAAKSAIAGGVGGMAVGAGVARRRRSSGVGGGRAAAATVVVRQSPSRRLFGGGGKTALKLPDCCS